MSILLSPSKLLPQFIMHSMFKEFPVYPYLYNHNMINELNLIMEMTSGNLGPQTYQTLKKTLKETSRKKSKSFFSHIPFFSDVQCHTNEKSNVEGVEAANV